jgi:hypothetical protein
MEMVEVVIAVCCSGSSSIATGNVEVWHVMGSYPIQPRLHSHPPSFQVFFGEQRLLRSPWLLMSHRLSAKVLCVYN